MQKVIIRMAALLAVPVLATGQVSESADCPDGDSAMVVLAQRFVEGPPAYSFGIVNATTSAVLGVVLGSGGQLHSQPHTPSSMGTPLGWDAVHVIGHESAYSTYVWTARDSEAQIQAGESLAGFSVQLPRWEPEEPLFFLDESVDQKDLRMIPFYIWLADGSCYTGIVRRDGD